MEKNNRLLLKKKQKQSTFKIKFCSPFFWKKMFYFHQNMVFRLSEKFVYSRSSTIPFGFNNQLVKIYGGKKWSTRAIHKWNIGFKFGELTWNRKMARYKAKQLKKKKKK